jgi:hypothetical protein
MSEYSDILHNVIEAAQGYPAQLRVYLQADQRPDTAALAAELREYESVLPSSRSYVGPYCLVLIRKIEFESEEPFRAECVKTATVVSKFLEGGSASLECLYDTSNGVTRFSLHLRKEWGSEAFVV